jgi:hypothetical protein
VPVRWSRPDFSNGKRSSSRVPGRRACRARHISSAQAVSRHPEIRRGLGRQDRRSPAARGTPSPWNSRVIQVQRPADHTRNPPPGGHARTDSSQHDDEGRDAVRTIGCPREWGRPAGV